MTAPAPVGRVPGRKVVPVVLGLIAVAVAAGLGVWFLNRFPNGAIVALTPVDDARVLVLRHGYEARRYLHLTMEGEGGARLWSATLFGAPPDARPVATASLATVRAHEARGNLSTHAYRLDDGSFAFRAAQLGPRLAYDSEGLALVRGETLYTLSFGDGAELVAVGVDGRAAFRLELPHGPGRPRLEAVGERLYVDVGDGRLRVLDAGTGAVLDEREASFCASGDAVFALEGGTITRVDGAAGPALGVPDLDGGPPLWACGQRGDEWVFFMGDPREGPVRVLAFAPGTAAPRYDVRVGEGAAPGIEDEGPAGRLPDVVPLPDGPRGLLSLDLRTGRVAHRWEVEGREPWSLRRLVGRTLLRTGERLGVLGDEGELGPGAVAEGLGGVAEVPGGARLWVWSGPSFVALDPATLEVVAGGAGRVEVRPEAPPLRPR